MIVILCTGASFVKKNCCVVAGIVSFHTAGQHILIFRYLEPYPSKDIEVDLSHIISYDVIILPSN